MTSRKAIEASGAFQILTIALTLGMQIGDKYSLLQITSSAGICSLELAGLTDGSRSSNSAGNLRHFAPGDEIGWGLEQRLV